ncbi:MAG: PhzF family phenazine biosynthesis protein [Saprospiraceae bacterium]
MYQVDAFTNKLFAGNPAAVCPLSKWLDDDLMQKIAMENNLSETVFYVKDGNRYLIRWFTPSIEVDLCGHATLAAAFVLFYCEGHKSDIIHFFSPRSGNLSVKKESPFLTLNFPVDILKEIAVSDEMAVGFNFMPRAAFMGKTDLMLIFENEKEIFELQPRFDVISSWKVRGVIVTSAGDEVDFVSRFFAPQSGVNEDPVTGSAHTSLTPYWAGVTGKTKLTAIQLSSRKGYLKCNLLNDRVEISGEAKLFLTGEINIGIDWKD